MTYNPTFYIGGYNSGGASTYKAEISHIWIRKSQAYPFALIGIVPTDCTCPSGCAVGEYMDSGICTACPVNTYQDTAVFTGTACTACPTTGSSTLGVTGSSTSLACVCSAGFYGPDGGPCTACGVDTYSELSGETSCHNCPSGSSTLDATGSTTSLTCTCGVGFYGADGGPCTACGVDTYSDLHGQSSCTACPANSGTDGATGQSDLTACLVAPGYVDAGWISGQDNQGVYTSFSELGSVSRYTLEACKDACVQDAQCNVISYVPNTCKKYFGGSGPWSLSANPLSSWWFFVDYRVPCPIGTYQPSYNGTACIACSNGAVTSSTASTAATDCLCTETGYTGAAGSTCTCDAGYYRSSVCKRPSYVFIREGSSARYPTCTPCGQPAPTCSTRAHLMHIIISTSPALHLESSPTSPLHHHHIYHPHHLSLTSSPASAQLVVPVRRLLHPRLPRRPLPDPPARTPPRRFHPRAPQANAPTQPARSPCATCSC